MRVEYLLLMQPLPTLADRLAVTQYIDAAYCYRCTVVCVSVCRFLPVTTNFDR